MSTTRGRSICVLAIATFALAAVPAMAACPYSYCPCTTLQYRTCWGQTATQPATICDDFLIGGSGNDVLAGWDGYDTLLGYGGDDRLCGENDGDCMYGGDGVDRMTGGSGNDCMYGGNGGDYMNGEAGNDTIYGEGGHDPQLQGSWGNDYIDGGPGSNSIEGNWDYDQCFNASFFLQCEVCDGGPCP